jgi:uncharacterized protein DUF2846
VFEALREMTFNLMEGSMWRVLSIALLLAGCAQLPQTQADIQAKRFESVSDKSVIYVVRTPMDSWESSGVALDNNAQISTHRGTYYRWEVAPGTHRISGTGFGTAAVTLSTAPGKIYFVEHTVLGDKDDGGVTNTRLKEIGDQNGRALVALAEMVR